MLHCSSFYHLQLMYFNGIQRQFIQTFRCFNNHFVCLSRQPYDYVSSGFNPSFCGFPYRFYGTVVCVSSVYVFKCGVVGGLYAVFYANEGFLIQFLQVVKQFIVYAIGSGAYDYAFYTLTDRASSYKSLRLCKSLYVFV